MHYCVVEISIIMHDIDVSFIAMPCLHIFNKYAQDSANVMAKNEIQNKDEARQRCYKGTGEKNPIMRIRFDESTSTAFTW